MAVDRIHGLPLTNVHAASRVATGLPFGIPAGVLDRCDIDSATVIKFLRLSDMKQTIRFLSGAAPVKPLPGEATELVTNPGWAF